MELGKLVKYIYFVIKLRTLMTEPNQKTVLNTLKPLKIECNDLQYADTRLVSKGLFPIQLPGFGVVIYHVVSVHSLGPISWQLIAIGDGL